MSGSNVQYLKQLLHGFLSLWLFFALASTKSQQDRLTAECPGPLRFYADLGCKPVYKNPGDRCAVRYDCSHLHNRSLDKCYANGTEYDIGDRLRDEDRINPCDFNCHCGKQDNVSKFHCAIVDCALKEAKPGCYLTRSGDTCCSSKEICPESQTPENVLKCEVDGQTYSEGELFYPEGSSNILCQCLPRDKGEGVVPFCRKVSCGIRQQDPLKIRNHCAPLYGLNRSPINSCSWGFRCPNADDTVIQPNNEHKDEHDHNMCKFGDLKLNIGDELNQSTDFRSECYRCACEVPPVLTCRQLAYKECKVKYPQTN